MKVYIAAMYGMRASVNTICRPLLEAAGHEVTARWLWEDEPPGSEEASAVKDLADVDRADALVLLCNPLGTKYSGGGRHVEMGYALGKGKVVVTVGDRETIFCHHPLVHVVPNFPAAVALLAGMSPPAPRPQAMLRWCVDTFGPVAADRVERAVRLLEEAMELAQAEGVHSEMVRRLRHRVYSRPPGRLTQEVGQVHNLLLCLAENAGLDAEALGREEFARCQAVPREEFTRRQAAKVEGGLTGGHTRTGRWTMDRVSGGEGRDRDGTQ